MHHIIASTRACKPVNMRAFSILISTNFSSSGFLIRRWPSTTWYPTNIQAATLNNLNTKSFTVNKSLVDLQNEMSSSYFIGLWEYYHGNNGQRGRKENYRDGKRDGLWEYFNYDGSLERTETWKNGVKQ